MFFQHNQLPGPYTGVLSVIYLYFIPRRTVPFGNWMLYLQLNR